MNIFDAAIILAGLAAAAGFLFAWVVRAPRKARPDAERIDALLPQTQCGRCGFSACRPYAEAIVRGEADINQCPPGGDSGVRALARLLGHKPKPLNPKHGTPPQQPSVAWIDETACIGCTRCIQACPVDAILGAAKQMHTVIRSECTGCELCIEPCPVNCIHMRALPEDARAHPPRSQNPLLAIWRHGARSQGQDRHKADRARERYQHRIARLAREHHERRQRQDRKNPMPPRDLDGIDKKAVIQAALEQARRRQAAMASKRKTATGTRSQ